MSDAPGYAVSGWQRDRPPAAVAPPLGRDVETSVVVVGAGLAGLATAYQLSRMMPADELLVLEASHAGAGASGRSTGIAGPGVGGPITGLVRRFGPEVAGRMFGASLDGIGALRRLAGALPGGCELTDGYQLVTAAAPAHAARLRRQAEILCGLGFDVGYLDRAQTAARLGTDRYHGALCYPDVALVNPWLLCQALRAVLVAAGVRVAEHTAVTSLAGGDPVTLTAGGRRVRARHAVLATDGFTPALGLFRRSVAVVRTHVLRTDPLPPELLARTGWDGAGAVIDSRSFFNYFRLTAQGHLLFGGGPAMLEARAGERGVAGVRSRLGRELAGVFPALATVPVTDFWSGVTASTFDRLPIVGPVPGEPGVWFAGAWCGHGLALSALTAELLAPRLAGAADWPEPARILPWLRHDAAPMPSGRVGSLLLAGYLRGLDTADRLAAARPPVAARPASAGGRSTGAAGGAVTARAGSAPVSPSGPHHRVDVAIVGARVAGSALAARLAAAGLSVAVFDRESLPAPTLSTHILHDTEDLRIEGVYDDLVALGVPPLTDVWVRLDDIELRLHHPENPGMCARRDLLDRVLLDRAVAAGAKAFTGTPVVGLRRADDGTVCGVRAQNPDGSVSEVSARLVVGADGRNSSVARWVGAQQYLTTRSERALLWRYFRGKHLSPALHWHRVGEHIVSVLPTGPDEFVLIAQPPDRVQAGLANADVESFLRHVEAVSPAVAELARDAEPVGPVHRMVRYPCYFRHPYGPGWALVGDAGHGKDATLGHGINDALRNTRALAAVLAAHWSDPSALERGMRRWARHRDRTELANYWYAQDLGRAARITAMERAILAGLQRSPRAVRRLDDVMGDRLSADRLLTLGRLLAASARRVRAGAAPRVVAGEAFQLVGQAWRRHRAAVRRDASAPPPVQL
ncbi:FAD-dependent oxidoreductase [Micromonospora sp. NPDC007271]|uniref:FAD-dependent oxidoreductase n=1 Tax=Micromonospora sp. NPDC007271 TaxID=3154587 RepID=UPI0033D7F759